MKLKKVATITVLGVLLSSVPVVQAQQEISVYVNGQKLQFETPPVIIDGTTLVPMRALFEALGAEVSWNDDTQTAIGSKQGVFVSVEIGKEYISRCSIDIPVETPARIIDGNTMIPLRIVSESFGLSVSWSDVTNSIYMYDTGSIQSIPWGDTLTYCGEVSNNAANGYGIIYNNKSEFYYYEMGYFKDNVILEGVYFGTYITFTGEFEDGLPCYGTMYYTITEDTTESSPSSYTGEIKDFEPHGYGVQTSFDGTVFTGSFNSGHRNGEGILKFTDGSYFKGTWINGKMNGEGVFHDAYDNMTFYGNFVDCGFEGVVTVYDNNNNETATAYYENGKFKYFID